nr:MAG TPA: hypothetical protein [Caudoviricetes sp.]
MRAADPAPGGSELGGGGRNLRLCPTCPHHRPDPYKHEGHV